MLTIDAVRFDLNNRVVIHTFFFRESGQGNASLPNRFSQSYLRWRVQTPDDVNMSDPPHYTINEESSDKKNAILYTV